MANLSHSTLVNVMPVYPPSGSQKNPSDAAVVGHLDTA